MVLPLVPVTPMSVIRLDGFPYTQQAISPSLPRGSASTKTGTPVAAARALPVRVGQDRDGARGHRVGAERGAVHPAAGQGDVQVAGRHRARVEGDAADEAEIVR